MTNEVSLTERYVHVFGDGKAVDVVVQSALKGKHRARCLCFLGCVHFNPADPARNCEIAQAVYGNCVKFDIVTPVWECPKFATNDQRQPV